jgi:YHS domain-containing protein
MFMEDPPDVTAETNPTRRRTISLISIEVLIDPAPGVLSPAARFATPFKACDIIHGIFNADKGLCPVCGMDGDPTTPSLYKGTTYLFCMRDHKEVFDKAPARFVS